ncbi:MAG: pirin family protein [Pseudomonadales bacterium]|jgi:redox-sensitive bicupin YhaK (pirin superfamily)|nr:pirin family protein [Pseudomonadales bacterium]
MSTIASAWPGGPAAIAAPRMLEGAGFEVRRPLPCGALQSVGPFIMLDHIGPEDVGPGEALGAPRHPHAGLETLTIYLESGGEHRDSLGNHSVTGPGEIQWMRAGRGLVHDEGPHPGLLRDGGRSHAVQLWLDLPGEYRSLEPAYRHVRAAEIPVCEEVGVRLRVLAGDAAGLRGPVDTVTAPLLLHVFLEPGARWTHALAVAQLGTYVLAGGLAGLRADGELPDGTLLLNPPERLVAGAQGAELLVLGGPALPAPPFRHGPFVADDRAGMIATVERYQRGDFGDVATPGEPA